mmetsp:Transcript_41004/g.34548  ORF Transcript_41004/g.34548 Transcript_41004/m.34548 type:complete len:170 (-) Transcript_41004:404-913(-)
MVKKYYDKNYKERSQPKSRQSLGILEKKKDWMQRSKHFKQEKLRLEEMKLKNELKNKNERDKNMGNISTIKRKKLIKELLGNDRSKLVELYPDDNKLNSAELSLLRKDVNLLNYKKENIDKENIKIKESFIDLNSYDRSEHIYFGDLEQNVSFLKDKKDKISKLINEDK